MSKSLFMRANEGVENISSAHDVANQMEVQVEVLVLARNATSSFNITSLEADAGSMEQRHIAVCENFAKQLFY